MPSPSDSPEDPPADTPTTTGYDLDALRAAYGDFHERVRTFEVDRAKYETMVAASDDDAIGGARVLLHRDGEALLVSNRGEDGWDTVGGAREAGETPETTARREVREEVGLRVELRDAIQVNEYGFRPEDGDDDRVAGLWVVFDGTPEGDRDLRIQESELDAARWFDSTPDDPDPGSKYAIERFFGDC